MLARNFLLLRNISGNNFFMASSRVLRSQIRFTSSNTNVEIDLKKEIFYVDVNGKRACIEFEKDGNFIKLLHTYVPKELEGRGLGKVLSKGALDYVAENNLKAEIVCHFVQHYVENYGEQYKKYLK